MEVEGKSNDQGSGNLYFEDEQLLNLTARY